MGGRIGHEEMLRHGDALLRYALSRVGGDRHTAEDLVQDTLMTACTKVDSFEGQSSVQTWLTGILRHKILDHHRWRQRHPADGLAEARQQAQDEDPWFTQRGAWRVDPNAGLESMEADPSRAMDREELRAVLRLCIDQLPGSLHRVFVLRELEDMEPAEVCETAGISRRSLAVFMYRARQSLRQCLQERWGAP